MINEIILENIATYKNIVRIQPKKLNFLYGNNGSGKTTISNLLGNYIVSDDSMVKSKSNREQILVYNKKFVQKMFKSDSSVPGVFTLGEDSVEMQNELEELRIEVVDKNKKIERKNEAISEYKRKESDERETFNEVCWKKQQDIGSRFPKALVGYRNKKTSFAEKCIDVFKSWDRKSKYILSDIETQYNIAYSNNLQLYPYLDYFNETDVENSEKSNLLKKIITGDLNSSFGDFIEHLSNSDWVQAGLVYLDNDQEKCPFCQQNIENNIKKELLNYFDETYEQDCNELDQFINDYKNFFDNIDEKLKDLIDGNNTFIDISYFDALYNEFHSIFLLNLEELQKKKKSPSVQIQIKTLLPQIKKINNCLESANKLIEKNNYTFEFQESEQSHCRDMLWEHIVSELEINISDRITKIKSREAAIEGITNKIEIIDRERQEIEERMKYIQQGITSVNPTANEINSILEKFDFKGFYLKENPDQVGTYIILREDGSLVGETLSEGEYNFITFLYFYCLVYGSSDSVATAREKIVVIDDPISSLDSNVLFIVSTLVKKIIKDCKENKFGIDQIFILTHNVYFHKEITFLSSRESFKKDEAYYGVVRKNDNISYVVEYDSNPIQTTYQLLWQDLITENLSSSTKFNTMRRILEYYFGVLGGINVEDCINSFEGTDKTVCRSLISCINDGSHYISDDFVISLDMDNITRYTNIFKDIFIKMGQEAHYNMMMKIETDKNDITYNMR
ncbi:AAA family ATPase [Listeria kieliensis]